MNEINDTLKTIPIYVKEASIPWSNPSIRIAVDDKIVYSSQGISEYSILYRPEIELSYGKHIVSVSTLDSLYYSVDTIDVNRSENQFWIRVVFERARSLDTYLNEVVSIYFKNRTEGKNLSEEQKSEEMDYIRKEVMKQKGEIAKTFKAIQSSRFEILYTDNPFDQKSAQ